MYPMYINALEEGSLALLHLPPISYYREDYIQKENNHVVICLITWSVFSLNTLLVGHLHRKLITLHNGNIVCLIEIYWVSFSTNAI